jgi:hypothetical protein
MARNVTLSAVNSRLPNHGITVKVDDSASLKQSGRLTIGKAKIRWTPSGKGIKIGGALSKEKTWEELIEFFTQ